MDKHPKVSIILPIYNGEKTISKTLDSLLNQSYSDYELVACIDGTSDGSEEILKGLNDPRIRIIKNQKNMGLGRTLNKLISYTNPNAPYLAIAEQDDWYYPYRLEMQVKFLDENPEVGLVSGIADHIRGGRINGKVPGMLVRGLQYPKDPIEMLKLNFREKIKVQQTCMMFRRSVHIDNGFYFSQHFHTVPIDWMYILRFSLVSQIHGFNTSLVKKDREGDRNSATSNLQMMHYNDRELIRSAYWEFSKILTKDDYKYALNSKIFEEGKMGHLPVYFKRFVEAMQNNPLDPRFKDYFLNLKKRVKMRTGR
ncbi:MAG: glycosyltransferase [Bacteroidota bacterium]|nr:glycosyltransferase [Bacteroidota bacterium]